MVSAFEIYAESRYCQNVGESWRNGNLGKATSIIEEKGKVMGIKW